MITCDKGRTRIKGDLSTIQAEMAMIIRGVREILKGEYGKERAEERIQRLVRASEMTQEEMKKETEAMKREIAREIVESFMK